MDEVILVNQYDEQVGTMEKLEAHEKGVLHRAFSVLLYNSKGEILLQKRAAGKYHSAGLWTNACCSHPMPGEKTEAASRRRLKEEMGIDAELKFAYKFIYRTKLDKNLAEHELDHVFTGFFDGTPVINKSEVEDWKFVNVEWLLEDMRNNPGNYTFWFRHIMNDPKLTESRL